MSLKDRIESFAVLESEALLSRKNEALQLFAEFREALNNGEARAAEPDTSASSWHVNIWVKKGILLGFRIGALQEVSASSPWSFFDKETIPVRSFTSSDGVRIVPGGTSVRDGACVSSGVIIMPPAYINIGAYIGKGTLVDSHALVGSCAQIGERVHISAAAQIGGVLEPAGAMPVIVEDDVLIGGNCGVYEGCIVKRRAVLGSGVILTGSTPIYDLVNEKIIARPSDDMPLVVPEGAVIIAGSRTITARSGFAQQHGLALYTPIIIKYRDEKTDARTALESVLR